MNDKQQFLALIKSNIDKSGYHINIVNSTNEPRYAYTIGVSKIHGFELIFAGGIYYMKDELFLIFDTIVKELKKEKNPISQKISIGTLGTFSFSKVMSSWSKLTMLGVFDYYKVSHMEVFQIIPDLKHYTREIPNMAKEWDASSEPVWQWLIRDWDYPVPKDSTIVTNLDALYGEPITEMMRCEENGWEMFAGAGPDVQKKDMRVVSFGTLLGIDTSLWPAVNLDIGKGLWRDSIHSEWNKWG